MKTRILIVIAALLLGGAGPYRWVDEEGRVHYSDVPPKGVLPKVEAPKLEAPKPAAAPAAQDATRPSTAAVRTLNTYVLREGGGRGAAAFRLAIAVEAPGVEDAQVEAEFENPADPARPLAGERMEKPGSLKEQFMMVTPPFPAIECRAYRVTVRVYSGAARDAPVATLRDTIVSRDCPG